MINHTQEVLNKAKQIELIISDVDGVLTQGELFFDKDGNEMFGKFNIYDGFAFIIANECGIHTAIISGRHSMCTENRFNKLRCNEIHTGILNKKEKLIEVATRLNIPYDKIAFVGDDLIDLSAMHMVGLTIAPKNAVSEVLKSVDHVTETLGGRGVFREVVELILHAQGKLDGYIKQYHNS